MYLKRDYDLSDPKRPRCVGVRVLNAGERWKVSTRLVQRALAEGWMAIADGKITLRGDQTLVYRIERGPGWYCCHCGAELNDELSAKTHLLGRHPGLPSPDDENPAGYLRTHYFDCKQEA